jgi:hypothetical protein
MRVDNALASFCKISADQNIFAKTRRKGRPFQSRALPSQDGDGCGRFNAIVYFLGKAAAVVAESLMHR